MHSSQCVKNQFEQVKELGINKFGPNKNLKFLILKATFFPPHKCQTDKLTNIIQKCTGKVAFPPTFHYAYCSVIFRTKFWEFLMLVNNPNFSTNHVFSDMFSVVKSILIFHTDRNKQDTHANLSSLENY